MKPMSFAYRPDIDGLRALAVLSVVIFHAFPEALRGGFVGVDVFFVISGYLISGILFKNLDNHSWRLLQFYGKRVRRIFPALIVVLLFCLIFGYFVLYDDEYQNLGKHIGAGSGFMSNILLWQESGYFDKAAELKPLLHLWSLGIEEQFYIFWPCLLFLAWRRALSPWLFIGLLFLISFILNVLKVHHHAVFVFYSPFMRVWELLLGALLAYAHHHKITIRSASWMNEALAFLGLLLLISSVFLLDKNKLYPSFWALLPTLGTVLLISSADSLIHKKVLSHPLMVGVGLISYPLYLWHWPLLAYAHIIFSSQVPNVLIISLLGMSVLLATLTYQWVEKPLRFNDQLAKQSIWTLCALLASIGILGLFIYQHEGIKSRQLVVSQKTALFNLNGFDAYKNRVQACDLKTQNIEALSLCFQTKKGTSTHVLWGDSHAEHLFPGIMSKDKNNNWLVIGHTGCPPLLGVPVFRAGKTDVCVKNNATALKAILDSPAIKTVVLASMGPFYISDVGYAAQHSGENSPINWHMQSNLSKKTSKATLFYQGMDAAITQLEAHGKQVVLYRDVPEVPFMPESCLKRPLAPMPHACQMSFSEAVLMRQKQYYQILLDLKKAHPQVRLFDSVASICDTSICNVRQDNQLVYRDGHHLSLYGSQLLATPFLDWLVTTTHSI